MRHLLIISVLLTGCSAGNLDTTVTEQSQASTALNPLNSSVSEPTSGFCHPIRFWGASAHAGARIMTWGVPASGGWTLEDSNTVHAYPENTSLGVFAANIECHDWSEITHKSSGPGVDAPKYLNWNQTTDTTWVAGSVAMAGWNNQSPCWLDGLAHMSATGEHSWLSLPGGTWTLNAEGYAALYAEARCAWLGRPIGYPLSFMTATPGHPAYEAFGPSAGTCFVTNVSGSVDDGVAGFTKQDPWKLEASGSVTSVQGYCVRY